MRLTVRLTFAGYEAMHELLSCAVLTTSLTNMVSKMFHYTCLRLTAIVLLYLQCAEAFWRIPCSVSEESRIDPVLSPGQISTHVHKFAGGISQFLSTSKPQIFD